MKRILLFFSFILCLSTVATAQTAHLKIANDLYVKGQYADAAKLYEQILNKQGVAPELYYNLGNAYYKLNETGKAILNFERALRLDPGYDDARFNLEIAQQKVVDNILQTPTFFVGRWIEIFIKWLSSNQWLLISFLLFITSLALGFVFVFGPSLFVRKASFYSGVVLLIVSITTLVFSGIRKGQVVNHDEAIIMTGVVTIKSSPDKSGTDLFPLHEGTKVGIKTSLGSWVEIVLANGNVGWVEVENIEKI